MRNFENEKFHFNFNVILTKSLCLFSSSFWIFLFHCIALLSRSVIARFVLESTAMSFMFVVFEPTKASVILAKVNVQF